MKMEFSRVLLWMLHAGACVTIVLGHPLEKMPPVFSSHYITQGELRLPYAELKEPFMAWVDLTHNSSRVDFYGGMTKNYHLANSGKYGVSLKVAPMTTETVLNQINCFKVNGSEENPVSAETIIPDLTGFKHIRNETTNGQMCEVWQKKETVGKKTNKYTAWINNGDTVRPVVYEMKGYDSLLGSHYDHYIIIYHSFYSDTPPSSIFEVDENLKCHGFPGPGDQDVYIMNPLAEFVHNKVQHVENSFNDFKNTYQRQYGHLKEHEHRKNTFRQNMRFIHSKNRAGLSYTLGVNHLADRTNTELKYLRGRRYTKGYNGGQSFNYSAKELAAAPETLDWRLYGAVTPVKDQSVCGSCWSFGTTGAVEGAYFMKHQNLAKLSQQALMDCSWGFGNNGCDGGEDFRSYQWIMKHGIPTEDAYGHYLGADGYCHIADIPDEGLVHMKGYVNVTSGSVDALKVALAKHGPVSVAIDASHRSLSFYANGVYYEEDCGNKPDELDHAVLAVGYGTMNGEKYWLVKNSWSTYWGNDGYVLMSQKDNNCGVATDPTYVLM